MKPERLSRQVIYQSGWVNLYVDQVRFPDGRIIERHHLLDFEQPSVVVFVQEEKMRILLVEICRYTTGSTSWELPAGGIEKGEGAIEAAKREVLEESGYSTKGHKQVYIYNPLNGIANKKVHVVTCRLERREHNFEAGEASQAKWFSWEQILRMIERNEITDGVSLVALLLCGKGVNQDG